MAPIWEYGKREREQRPLRRKRRRMDEVTEVAVAIQEERIKAENKQRLLPMLCADIFIRNSNSRKPGQTYV
jgi:hypothetical protein